jgi:hypothetical protein
VPAVFTFFSFAIQISRIHITNTEHLHHGWLCLFFAAGSALHTSDAFSGIPLRGLCMQCCAA